MPDDECVMATPGTTIRRAPLPVLRAAVFALVGTVLGVSAHHLVAEGPAPWRESGVAVGVLFALGLAGARRPRPLGAVVAVCGIAQGGLHLWLSSAHAQHGAGTSPPLSPHLHHGVGSHAGWHEQPHDSVTMAALHAGVALLVGVLLHRADSACWDLARGLATAAGAVHARIATAWALLIGRVAPAEPRPPAPARVRPEQSPLRSVVLAHAVMRRGPPQAGPAHLI
ncbi:hypothetical protein ACFQ8O_37705 [Streptomyces coelicoflavus]|uniref:hypothetical protein n=1 Tax=Streptomyces coelicoflavus TaxID=285562 RepID=UPI0036820E32